MDYTVRRNDTLASIARRHNTTADALARENHLANPNAIRPGQRLRVPGDRDEFTPARTQAPVTLNADAQFCPMPRSGMTPIAPQNQSVAPWASTFRPGWESLIARSGFGRDQAAGRDVRLQVPFYLQTEAGHGFTPGAEACFDAASQMATDAGATVRGPYQSTWVGRSENRQGRLTVRPERVTEGRARIDAELDAGRPVVVGVSHKDARYNVDRLTDHFVTITGRGTDADGSRYYTFHDPGVRGGDDTNPRSRFYVDSATGNLYRPANPLGGRDLDDRRYELSMVR